MTIYIVTDMREKNKFETMILCLTAKEAVKIKESFKDEQYYEIHIREAF